MRPTLTLCPDETHHWNENKKPAPIVIIPKTHGRPQTPQTKPQDAVGGDGATTRPPDAETRALCSVQTTHANTPAPETEQAGPMTAAQGAPSA